jgi:hypothetical protein
MSAAMMKHIPRKVARGMGCGVARWKAAIREILERCTVCGGFEPIYSFIVW